MPKHEPDQSDPLELVAAAAEHEQDTAYLARCLAGEFLALGLEAQAVMTLFRSPEYVLAHRAWSELGEVRVFQIVRELERWREAAAAARGGNHA